MDASPSLLPSDPAQLSASEAAALIRDKQLSCEELVRACLARISHRDPVVKGLAVSGPGSRHPPRPSA